MGLRSPVALAGVVGVGVPVLAAGVVAGLTIKTGETGPYPTSASTESTSSTPTATLQAAPVVAPVVADPVGFQPDSINFISADEGWALGRTYPCASEPCQSLRHTTDGGRTWQAVTLPAPLLPNSPTHDTNARGWVKFADARNGWVGVDGTLFATHDGGKSWKQVPLDINAVMGDFTLTVAEDSAYIAATQPGEKTVLFTSPVDSDSWTETTDLPVAVGGGPDPSAAVTVVGTRAWVVVTNRTRSGARLVDGTWSPWKLPCGGNGPADWHALSERRVLALCGRPGPAQNDSATTHLMTSTDGGATFTDTGQLAPSLANDAVLMPADASHLVAALDDRVLTSADGGESWTIAYTAPDRDWEPVAGEFTTETTGFVILAHTGSAHNASMMLTTDDAGRTWTPVSFG
ncbi:hypothetical protein [Nocardia sp. CDC160]|uniref:hypothetical protein n=1 Tax=Nocardia sp. CDC160 TaxID=3112166 RepID=UPI002DBB47BB|nr:hypothetical protein [Nocardia sp. CDC160]MEC3917331.1 hypothetical protein [Nocardia sp. CDC160]